MAIWEEGSGPTTSWGQEAGMAGNANQENVATLASKATQAASNAEDSEDAAALSATAAAGSATAAAGSATLAGQHKTAAETAQGLAETAQGLSEGARDAALGYSNTASGHATTATTQAGIATTQASTATTQAGIATTQAGIATTKAGEAAGSASNAADSETNAGTSATNAGLSSADAQKLAVNPEDSQFILSDGATTGYSALHHKEKAIDAQASAEAARDTALGYRDTAAGHASTATTKASEAAGSASTATTEASTATTQAGIATTQAGIATTQAGIATDKASAAATSATSAAASYDNFDDRYLGSKANDPTVDNDGDALLTGALYFNSTTDVMKVYDGSAWVAAYASIAGITLDNVTTDGNTTTNAITVGGMTSTGPVILNADPSSNLGAATKQYVDTIAAAGVHYHDPVRVEQEGNLNAAYNNGSSGVGATLTNSGTQEALVIDGVTLLSGDRVLIYEQTNQAHNGIYTVTDVGSGSTNWVLTRAVDADSYAPSDPDSFGQGDAFYVQEGTMGAGETYVMTTEGPITFGTTNIHFSQISSAQVYSGSTGIDITGTTISSTATLADVTTAGNSTTNSIEVGGVTSTGNVTASNLNTTDWDAAYGWGNHASAGYLTSFTETDPTVPSHVKGITTTNISNWNTAYGWGDHAGLYPTYTGSGASGTWAINITGNAATATDASTLGGASASVNASNDTIVKRHASGYIFANYFNTTPNDVTGAITRICVETGNDGYIRHATGAVLNDTLAVSASATITQRRTHSGIIDAFQGILGGYNDGNASGSNWGCNIWGMGDSYDGSGAATAFVPGSYNVCWLRSGNAKYISSVGEGMYVFSQSATTAKGGIGTGGIWTSGNVTAYSDIRVKTNIEHIPDALDKVCQLNGYTFDRTDVEYDELTNEPDKPIRQTGVIAQEVLEVLPEAVVGTEEGHYSVAYGNMVGLLIEAIKEQQGQIEDLKAEVEALKVAK